MEHYRKRAEQIWLTIIANEKHKRLLSHPSHGFMYILFCHFFFPTLPNNENYVLCWKRRKLPSVENFSLSHSYRQSVFCWRRQQNDEKKREKEIENEERKKDVKGNQFDYSCHSLSLKCLDQSLAMKDSEPFSPSFVVSCWRQMKLFSFSPLPFYANQIHLWHFKEHLEDAGSFFAIHSIIPHLHSCHHHTTSHTQTISWQRSSLHTSIYLSMWDLTKWKCSIFKMIYKNF